jgi:hypothetical protein
MLFCEQRQYRVAEASSASNRAPTVSAKYFFRRFCGHGRHVTPVPSQSAQMRRQLLPAAEERVRASLISVVSVVNDLASSSTNPAFYRWQRAHVRARDKSFVEGDGGPLTSPIALTAAKSLRMAIA